MKVSTIKVWDPLVRFVHWAIAGIVLFNLLNEGGYFFHRYAGYAALGLLIVRLIWGLIGTYHARFSTWWPSKVALTAYIQAKRNGSAPKYLSHNPMGAIMMLFLWGLLLFQGISGFLLGTDAFFGSGWLEEMHEISGYLFIPAVLIHVLAAIYESWRTRENLIASMVHGRKSGTQD